MTRSEFQQDYDRAKIALLVKQNAFVLKHIESGDIEKAKKVAALRIEPGLYDVEDERFFAHIDEVFEAIAEKADLRIYQRLPGTEQCLEYIEVREKHEIDGKWHRHWAVCFQEKGHKGRHRFWQYVDWLGQNEFVRLVRGFRKEKKRK